MCAEWLVSGTLLLAGQTWGSGFQSLSKSYQSFKKDFIITVPLQSSLLVVTASHAWQFPIRFLGNEEGKHLYSSRSRMLTVTENLVSTDVASKWHFLYDQD